MEGEAGWRIPLWPWRLLIWGWGTGLMGGEISQALLSGLWWGSPSVGLGLPGGLCYWLGNTLTVH